LIEASLKDEADYIITLDYDTLFDQLHVRRLIELMVSNPAADCIVANQMKRENNHAMLTLTTDPKTGDVRTEASVSEFDCHLTRIRSAHFGLAIFKATAFANLKKPWFMPVPDADGAWSEEIVVDGVKVKDGRIDEDVNFWLNWGACGNTLYLANNVQIGHIQLAATWPGNPEEQWKPVHQYLSDYERDGAPPYIVEKLHRVPPSDPVVKSVETATKESVSF